MLQRWLMVLLFGCLAPVVWAAAPKLAADPATGQVRVETDRYIARFDAGTLTYLYNRLTKKALVGSEQAPEKMSSRTSLVIQEKPLAAPVYRVPVLEGEPRSKVTVVKPAPNAVAVTFTGLKGGTRDFAPDCSLTLTLTVDAKSGDLLVDLSGTGTDEGVVGTTLAFTGVTQKYLFYTTNTGGLLQPGDTSAKWSPLAGTLEWGNFSMGKRTGPAGWIWPLPITLIANQEDPKSAFAFWCEDDKMQPKYYLGGQDGAAHASFEYPPYENLRKTQSVTWHINTYAGGWTEAAKPFAESFIRRGFTKTRAPWAKDISLIIQVPDLSPQWWEPLTKVFPPEDRKHILLYAQGWRKAGFDHDLWDYEPTDNFKQGAPKAREAGFHTLAYMQPMLVWGDSSKIQDPDFRAQVQLMQQNYSLDPFGKHPVEYTGQNHAYTPWRNLILNGAKNIIDNYGIEGIYLDSSFTMLPDGRGLIDGMTSYQGTHALLDGLRKIRPDIFLGTEMPNELIAWGADFGLHTGLEWATSWKEGKARSSHPINNYIFQHVLVTMTHANCPYTRTVRDYHLTEEIAERTGQVAAIGYDNMSYVTNPSTPEALYWVQKGRLFAHRGLRPYYPTTWEANVMSYLKAADGAIFVYEEMPYGSRLVERTPKGPVVQFGRAWKVGSFKSTDGLIPNWIGRAEDGAWLGLDTTESAYVLLNDGAVEKRVRITVLPDEVCIKNYQVTDQYTTLTLAARPQPKPADPKATPPAPPASVKITVVTAKPLLRVAPADGTLMSELPKSAAVPGFRYEMVVPVGKPIGLVWADAVALPFEYAGYYKTYWPTPQAGGPDKIGVLGIYGEWDQKWTSDIIGAKNPRPGTIYAFSLQARKTGEKDVTLTSFHTSAGTQGGGYFTDSGMLKVTTPDFAPVTQAGIRLPSLEYAWDHTLAVRIFGEGAEIKDFTGTTWVRPELGISDDKPIDLGAVAVNTASAPSPVRSIFNSQARVLTAGPATFATILYGTAHITVPAEKGKEYLQAIDQVGVQLIGEQAKLFAIVTDHQGATPQELKLLGADGKDGLSGGAAPEKEDFTVKFLGAPTPGTYTATLRIVTQAGNRGILSAGKPNEPAAGLYYVDIPVQVKVE